mmetsp:Transcript_23607/g.63732  ORF Transcript_23607/g.63732 Transcript_23607/m.63732 type:complete len:120 (-) Transcript_23607:63-422(-)
MGAIVGHQNKKSLIETQTRENTARNSCYADLEKTGDDVKNSVRPINGNSMKVRHCSTPSVRFSNNKGQFVNKDFRRSFATMQEACRAVNDYGDALSFVQAINLNEEITRQRQLRPEAFR